MPGSRSHLVALALVLIAFALLASAVIAEASPLPAPPQPSEAMPAPDSVAGLFAAAPTCREMSNGCRVCIRGTDGSPTCSLPGIACVPEGWQCRQDVPARR